MRFKEKKYSEEMWRQICDYVFDEYGEPIKEAKPFLESPKVFPHKLTSMHLGIMKTLTKRKFFKKTWNPFEGSHWERTKLEAPKMKFERKKD